MQYPGNSESADQHRRAVVRHFDELADTYDATGKWVRDRTLIDAIVSRVTDFPVADVACGNGIIAREIAMAAPHGVVYAVDSSPRMCEAARAAGVNAVVGHAESLPYTDGSLGTIVCRQALHYLDIPAALSDWSRCLKATGKAVVAQIGSTSDSVTDWWIMIKAALQPLRRDWFSLRRIEALIRDNNWRLSTYTTMRLRNTHSHDVFFCNSSVPRSEQLRVLAIWKGTSPADVCFEYDETNVYFTQEWIIWEMTPRRVTNE